MKRNEKMKFHVSRCNFYDISISQFDANKLYINIGMFDISKSCFTTYSL